MKKILIFPAGTEIAFEIHHALRYSKFVELYGGGSVRDHGEMLFRTCVEDIPFVGRPGFVEKLNRVTDELGIDYIYPAHDSACLALIQEQERLHARVVSSPRETVEICRSKNATYRHLEGADYLPRFYSGAEEVESYPVFVKPSVGQGAQGARRVDDREHLEELLASGTEYAVCEYLPGREVSVDCFTDRHGVLRFVSPRSRDRIKAGIAVRSHFLPRDEGIERIARDLNSRFAFNGAWFFQLKEDGNGEYKLMEVSPRIAGTSGLTRNRGVNLPLLTLYNMWGYDVDIIDNGGQLLLDRAFISRFESDISYDKVYVDFDDSLIIRGRVNLSLIAFLYQARNQGKSVYMLTKHRGDIREELERYNIAPGLFTRIIHLENSESKVPYIEPDSIFIDDSFAERKRIHDACGIPVFDLDMVESLLDWRA